MTARDAGNNNDTPAIVAPTWLEFEIKDTKLSVPDVTLSKENDTKLLEQLKSGFKRTIKWNKYRSQMTVQNNNNNINLFKELLQKITQQKIIETFNWWKKFLWFASKNWSRGFRENYRNEQ